jgi:putative membrane protein
LAFASFVLELIVLVSGGNSHWPEAMLVLSVTLTTVVALTGHLPLQNVLLATGIIALIGSAAHALCAVTAIPFGPIAFSNVGPKFFDVLPWSVPFLWVAVVLNSRGVARLILRPWRKLRTYGFWLMGVTAVLAVLFDLALEPFASKVRFFWVWRETKFPVSWCGVPIVNFLGWLVTALLILAFAAPALINKQVRPRQSPPDYHPLVVWLLALTLFAVGAVVAQFWLAAIMTALIAVAAAIFAIRGARW